MANGFNELNDIGPFYRDDPKPYAPPLDDRYEARLVEYHNISFNTDDVDEWDLKHVATREFHGAPVSDLYAQAAVWLQQQEGHGFIVVTGSNLQINEDETYDLTISVEVT